MLLMVPALAFVACNHPTPGEINGGTTTDNHSNPSEPIDPTTPTGEVEWEGCLYFPQEPQSAIQHQCTTQVGLTIHFTLDGTPSSDGTYAPTASLFSGFGLSDDSYEKPTVMACCTPAFDDEEALVLQPEYKACFHDLAENGCRSLWVQINEYKQKAPLLHQPQLQELADWIAEHQQECFDQFWEASGASAFDAEDEFDEFVLNHVWELPGSAETANIKDISIEASLGYVFDVFVPEYTVDQILCESQKDNNDVTFLQGNPDNGDVFELDEGDANFSGMYYEGSSEFTSANTSCSHCSIISIEEDTGGVWLHSMVLDTADTTVITDGTTVITVDRARIALYTHVFATEVTGPLGPQFTIPPGEAIFVVSAISEGTSSIDTASNADTIVLEFDSGTWLVSPFTFTYTDENEDQWTLETGQLSFVP